MGRPKINRQTRRYIQNMKKDQFIDYISHYAMECYDDGVRDSFMTMLLKLHDEFGFDNEKVERLLQACEVWMQACIKGEDNINANGIKEQLISEGITCLLKTDL